MKTNNYLVTGADLATMGYRQKPGTTPPLDGSIMSKGESNANYYIDPNVSPWSTYPDTRAPKYQDFPCPCVSSVGIDNTLAFGYSQTISYEDCSGNTLYIYAPYGQITVITACTFISGDSGPMAGCGILRGSVVGARLAAVDYGGCCYANYPCTTTSTTTLPQCNYNGLTVVCTPLPATINWSNAQASGSGYFIDSNLQINYTDTDGNPQTLTAMDDSSGTITVEGGSVVTAQAYCFTSTPPTYWGDLTQASIRITADGTTVDTPLTVGSDTGTQSASHAFIATPGSTKSVYARSTGNYTIGWSFQQSANSGDFSISVNGVQVVYTTVSNSGTITIIPGSYVQTGVSAGAQSFQTAQAELVITDGETTLYNESNQGYPSAGESYGPYYPTDNGTISAAAYEF